MLTPEQEKIKAFIAMKVSDFVTNHPAFRSKTLAPTIEQRIQVELEAKALTQHLVKASRILQDAKTTVTYVANAHDTTYRGKDD